MAWLVSPRFRKALAGPHIAKTRLDLYSQGVPQATDVHFEDGSITDQEVIAGQRRSLTLSIPDDYWWTRWLQLPGLEVRPYGGLDYGASDELCPLGVFEIQQRPRRLTPGTLQLTAPDRWGSRISQAGFLTDRWSNPTWSAALSLSRLIRESATSWQREQVVETLVDRGRTPRVLWRDKSQAMNDLAQSLAAEALFDRVGIPVIRNRRYGANVVTLRDGVGGTLTEMSRVSDQSRILNRVSVSSSNPDVKFDPYILSISDPNHPAHESKVGVKAKAFQSQSLRDRAAAGRMAKDILRRSSSWSRQLSGTMIVDFSLESGDIGRAVWREGDSERFRFQQLTTPLLAGTQTFTSTYTPEEIDVE